MNNRICDLLDLQYPLIQGGMAWVADAPLAAAVSNAGGLGVIGSGSMTVDLLVEQIREVRSLTDKPFGVNLMMLNPCVNELAQLMIEKQVPVVTTGAGSAGKFISLWKEAGIVVIPVVASVTQAKRQEQLGADAVVAEGNEAGGHIGEQTTMVLTPQVVDAVDIPVLCAGGIADGRAVAAAYMLGAEGVQVGTRFIASTECTAHDNYKQMLIRARDVDSVVTGRSGGHPVRSLRSKLQRKLLAMEKDGAGAQEMEELSLGSLRKAKIDGDLNEGSFMAGQVAGLVKEVLPCADIIQELFSEAEQVIRTKMKEGLR
ncbi:MAG: nitronate monooxygenase [Fastidiosipilaceae bacterium]|jgi:enoyl-[acyl-carrier protein] reductase II